MCNSKRREGRCDPACVWLNQFHFRELEENLSSISFCYDFYGLTEICITLSTDVTI